MNEVDLLKNSCSQIGLDLSENQINKFLNYKEFLLEYNQNVNLTAITEPKDVIQKHFIDSLNILKYINEEETVIDVGTGAGFPAIPLKILNEKLDITLLDSLNKRLIFIEKLIDLIELNNIKLIHSRVEDAGRNVNYREKYDVVTSRALAKLNVLVEYCLPLVKTGGKFIAMKGNDIEIEVLEAQNVIKLLGGKIEHIKQEKIPFTDITHNTIIISKLFKTPTTYPRNTIKISKNPIN